MFFKVIYRLAQLALRLFLTIAFAPKISGRENIFKKDGFIVACNHKSNFDPIMIGAYLPRQINFLAKKELFSNKLFGAVLRGLGVIPITRQTAEIGTLKAVIRLLKDSGVITVFPEGTRKSGSIQSVKSGAVLFAIKGQVPIIPAAISGDYKAFGKLRLTFGEPVYYSEYYDEKVSKEQLHSLSVDLINHIYHMGGGEGGGQNANTAL